MTYPYRNQTNIQPAYRQLTVPCKGKVGDLWVLTPLDQPGTPDPSAQGVASLWFCTKSDDGENNAVWARVQFDGVANCAIPIKDPPQDRPLLNRG